MAVYFVLQVKNKKSPSLLVFNLIFEVMFTRKGYHLQDRWEGRPDLEDAQNTVSQSTWEGWLCTNDSSSEGSKSISSSFNIYQYHIIPLNGF